MIFYKQAIYDDHNNENCRLTESGKVKFI